MLYQNVQQQTLKIIGNQMQLFTSLFEINSTFYLKYTIELTF